MSSEVPIFPEFKHSGNTYSTRVRVLGDKGYYFNLVTNNDLKKFLENIYLSIFMGKYSENLLTIEGVKVHELDPYQHTEEERLNLLYKYFK